MTDAKILKDAQYRKGLSIAFFNATNAAVEFAKINGLAGVIDPKKFIADWRDYFLEEHKKYYSEVVSSVGKVYDSKKTIDLLKSVKTKDELRLVWTALSEDERHDGDVIKVVKELKKQYAKS